MVMVTGSTPPRSDDAASTRSVDLSAIAGSGGVVWSLSPQGFHANLVVLDPDDAIPSHRNEAVDVLIVVLAGTGVVTVDDRGVAVAPLAAVLVPRGAQRSIVAGPSGMRYLTIHDRRGSLTVTRREVSAESGRTPRIPPPAAPTDRR